MSRAATLNRADTALQLAHAPLLAAQRLAVFAGSRDELRVPGPEIDDRAADTYVSHRLSHVGRRLPSVGPGRLA